MSHVVAHPILGITLASAFLFAALLVVCREFAMRGRRPEDE